MISVTGSIKGRMFFWSLLITATVLIVLGISLYSEIRESVLHSVEQTLHSKIQLLKGLLRAEQGMIELELADVVSGEYSIPRSGHYYKVLVDGEVLAASPSLVDDDFNFESRGDLISHDEQLQQNVYISTGPAKEKVMAVRHDFVLFDKGVTLYAVQSLEESIRLITRFRKILYSVIALNIFVLAFATLWISQKALKPLQTFSELIGRITHKTMGERITPEHHADEVRLIAESFNSMLGRLEAAFEAEKRLVAEASHGLKTPLAVIKSRCDVLLQKERTTEEYTKALGIIGNTADSMSSLINDMLSLTRLDSGVLSSSNFSAVPVDECIRNALKMVAFLARENDMKVNEHIPDNMMVRGDQDSLTEVFSNIMENAIRYSNAGGTVDISASVNKNYAQVSITDQGIGISDKDMKRIFDRFYRADSSRGTPGTGLGLSIAKAIIDAHGGMITVKSKVGEGSRFLVMLPLMTDRFDKGRVSL